MYGDIAPKFQKTCLGYWLRLVPNFTSIGEVSAEKPVTDQKTNCINLASHPYSVWR